MKKSTLILICSIYFLPLISNAQNNSGPQFNFLGVNSDTLKLSQFNTFIQTNNAENVITYNSTDTIKTKSFVFTIFKDGELMEHYNSQSFLTDESKNIIFKMFQGSKDFSNLYIVVVATQNGKQVELHGRSYVLSNK
jgi:hypothetical protein